MKKKIYIMLSFALMFPFIVVPSAKAVTQPLPELNRDHLYVQDHSHLLSSDEVRKINKLGVQLEKDTGIEMLVVTMDQVNEPKRDYALRLLRGYGVGKKDINNGIVIFLNLDKKNNAEDRGIEIQIGYGLEGYFNDAKVGRIIDDNGLQSFKDGRYDEGIMTLYQAMYDESQTAAKHKPKNEPWKQTFGDIMKDEMKQFFNHDFSWYLNFLFSLLVTPAGFLFLRSIFTDAKKALKLDIKQEVRDEAIFQKREIYCKKEGSSYNHGRSHDSNKGFWFFGDSSGDSSGGSSSGGFGGGSGGGGGAGRDF